MSLERVPGDSSAHRRGGGFVQNHMGICLLIRQCDKTVKVRGANEARDPGAQVGAGILSLAFRRFIVLIQFQVTRLGSVMSEEQYLGYSSLHNQGNRRSHSTMTSIILSIS